MEINIEQKNPNHFHEGYIPTNEFYTHVINSLEDYAVFTMDKELLINSWNSGAKNIFGYEEKEILGKPYYIMFTEEDIKNRIPEKETKTALKEGKSTSERWHLRKDKSRFYASGLVFLLNDPDGRHLGYVKVLRNITEKQKSEESIKNYLEELKQLNSHKEKTLSVLSHDLRSPLTSIIGTAALLESRFDNMNHDEVKQMLHLLHESSKNLLAILDNLVEWARVKHAAEIFSPKKINLNNCMKDAFSILNENAHTKNISLHNHIEEDIHVFADEKMLFSILRNLVSNAIKYTNTGGQITAEAKRKGDKITIEVKDTGIGLSKEQLKTIFVPKVETLVKEKNETSAGIGLLLVKEFVEKNGGKIGVESEEGKGTTFCFTLPAPKESSDS